MEPESSSLYPQVPATRPYLEATPSSPHDPSKSLKIHFKLSSHIRLGFPNGLFPSGFPTNTLCTLLSSPIRTTYHTHLIHLDFTTRTILCKKYRSFSYLLCSFLHYHVTSSLLGPKTLLNTLFSNILRLRSYLNVSDQVSHLYNTTGKVIVLYILIFKFLDSNLEHKRFCTE